jgi:hypothetical protein
MSHIYRMGYMTTRKSRIQAQLTAVQAALTKLYDTQLNFSEYENQSYAFDSGEGSQRTTRMDPLKIQEQIDRLEAKERHLINELYNMGIVSIKLRRK